MEIQEIKSRLGEFECFISVSSGKSASVGSETKPTCSLNWKVVEKRFIRTTNHKTGDISIHTESGTIRLWAKPVVTKQKIWMCGYRGDFHGQAIERDDGCWSCYSNDYEGNRIVVIVSKAIMERKLFDVENCFSIDKPEIYYS